MKKIATKLTHTVAKLINNISGSKYIGGDGFIINFFDNSITIGIEPLLGYEKVSEQDFLDYFKKETLPEMPDDVVFTTVISSNSDKPQHYSQTKSGMDVFDVARDWNIKEPEHFSALKYVLRLGKKDEATKEIDKAIDCLQRLKEVYEAKA